MRSRKREEFRNDTTRDATDLDGNGNLLLGEYQVHRFRIGDRYLEGLGSPGAGEPKTPGGGRGQVKSRDIVQHPLANRLVRTLAGKAEFLRDNVRELELAEVHATDFDAAVQQAADDAQPD